MPHSSHVSPTVTPGRLIYRPMSEPFSLLFSVRWPLTKLCLSPPPIFTHCSMSLFKSWLRRRGASGDAEGYGGSVCELCRASARSGRASDRLGSSRSSLHVVYQVTSANRRSMAVAVQMVARAKLRRYFLQGDVGASRLPTAD
jgi:hypothetical protein